MKISKRRLKKIIENLLREDDENYVSPTDNESGSDISDYRDDGGGIDDTKVSYEVDDNGNVAALVIEYDDGEVDEIIIKPDQREVYQSMLGDMGFDELISKGLEPGNDLTENEMGIMWTLLHEDIIEGDIDIDEIYEDIMQNKFGVFSNRQTRDMLRKSDRLEKLEKMQLPLNQKKPYVIIGKKKYYLDSYRTKRFKDPRGSEINPDLIKHRINLVNVRTKDRIVYSLDEEGKIKKSSDVFVTGYQMKDPPECSHPVPFQEVSMLRLWKSNQVQLQASLHLPAFPCP